MPDMEKKERVRIKGFAAYKDNSTELKGEGTSPLPLARTAYKRIM